MAKSRIITVQDLRCNETGIVPLCAISTALEEAIGDPIILDFSLTRWMDANLASPLGGLLEKAKSRGSTIRFANLPRKIRIALDKNGFLSAPGYDSLGTSLPYRIFPLTEAKEFSGYLEEHLQGHGIPSMSAGLRLRFLQGLAEIFNNCALHSRSGPGVFACGQAYPTRRYLDFTIADAGVGFQTNVSRYLGMRVPADEAIEWAMIEGNTTRQGDIPGGLGLKIVSQFVTKNNGALMILSGRGFWELNAEGARKKLLRIPFSGTMVNLRINTADQATYKLKTEQDPNAAL